MIRLGVLGSTKGTHLFTILNAIKNKTLSASIDIVLSNKADAIILERASSHGLSAQFINPAGLSREDYDQQVSAVLRQYAVDLVVLIGYMRILSPLFIREWRDKIINVHPSLLPAHAGKMDLEVHRAVLAAAEKTSGCSVHYVTEEVDAGPVLVQKRCAVLPEDSPESLKKRVQTLEAEALIEAIQQFQSASIN